MLELCRVLNAASIANWSVSPICCNKNNSSVTVRARRVAAKKWSISFSSLLSRENRFSKQYRSAAPNSWLPFAATRSGSAPEATPCTNHLINKGFLYSDVQYFSKRASDAEARRSTFRHFAKRRARDTAVLVSSGSSLYRISTSPSPTRDVIRILEPSGTDVRRERNEFIASVSKLSITRRTRNCSMYSSNSWVTLSRPASALIWFPSSPAAVWTTPRVFVILSRICWIPDAVSVLVLRETQTIASYLGSSGVSRSS